MCLLQQHNIVQKDNEQFEGNYNIKIKYNQSMYEPSLS